MGAHLLECGRDVFIGREALLAQRVAGIRRILACLTVEVAEGLPHGNEPLFDRGDHVVGYVMAGDHGHVVGRTIALAYLPVELAAAGTPLEVEILGERRPATVVGAPLYDPGQAGSPLPSTFALFDAAPVVVGMLRGLPR